MKASILYFISFGFNDAKLKLRRNMVNLREEPLTLKVPLVTETEFLPLLSVWYRADK